MDSRTVLFLADSGDPQAAGRVFGASKCERWGRRNLDACRYQAVDVPPAVVPGVRRLVGRLRRRLALIDFVVDASQEWWFRSLDPDGQWLWVERDTGLPIAAAVAQALASSGYGFTGQEL